MDNVYVTEPKLLAKYTNNSRYKFAVCKCPIPADYGIVIDSYKYKCDRPHQYRFKCTKCGLEGILYSK